MSVTCARSPVKRWTPDQHGLSANYAVWAHQRVQSGLSRPHTHVKCGCAHEHAFTHASWKIEGVGMAPLIVHSVVVMLHGMQRVPDHVARQRHACNGVDML